MVARPEAALQSARGAPRPEPDARRPLGAVAAYRVVVASPVWSLNGVNVFSSGLVRALNARGVDARILLTRPDAADSKPLPVPRDLPFDRLGADMAGEPRGGGRALERYLVQNAPCIFFPNNDYQASSAASQLPRDVAVIGIIHGDDPEHYAHARRLGRYWNAAVAVSENVAERTRAAAPSLARRTALIPHGVDIPAGLPRRDASARPLRIVYAGRLVDYPKRIFDLPVIMARLRRAGIPAELTIVGGGAHEGVLRRLCASAVARGSIRFAGLLDPPAVRRVMEASDVVLLTSSFEGMPLSLIEAMARGCVPVVSAVESGVPELVRDGENGFVVPVGGIDAFADRLRRLARDPALRAALSTRAYDTIAGGPWSTEAMVDRYLELFEHVMRDLESGSFLRPAGPVPSFRPPRLPLRAHLGPRARVAGLYLRQAFHAL